MPRFTSKWSSGYFEIELDGLTVRTSGGDPAHLWNRERAYPTEDAARYAYGRALASRQRDPSQIPVPVVEQAGSMLIAEERFAAGDDGFLAELLRVRAAGKLAALAARWYGDARPWARRQLLAYIDDGCARPEHKGLVKRLFKRAEAAGDDEAMAHFVAAFDGLRRRLLVPDRGMFGDPGLPATTPKTGSAEFSLATRRYLVRRAYRYFRKLAFSDLARYGRGLRAALALYRDDQLAGPAQLLDAWSLGHALYGRSPLIIKTTRGLGLAARARLGELAPAPQFPAAWQRVFRELIALADAPARTVRQWTVAWLRAHYADDLKTLGFAELRPWLLGPHGELQALAAELLVDLPELDRLAIADWLALLAIDNLDLLPTICAAVERHVAPARLDLAQCVALAGAAAAPVARLGLAWARAKPISSAADLQLLARLARARVAEVRDAGAAWLAELLASHPAAAPDHLRDLCDAPFADARRHALAAVAARPQPTALWFALTESPYPDVRTVVSEHAAAWRDAATPQTRRHVWLTALLAVHGGGVTKRGVARELAERIAGHPDEAAELLPVLGLALRSVRPGERTVALAALVRAVHASAELRALAGELLPELTITTQVAS